MVLEWRECEHGELEEVVRADLMAQQALCACGIYKFWCFGGLRAKPRLLQMLVDYWDPKSESFQIDGMSLTIEVEGHMLHYWAFSMRGSSEPSFSWWARRWPDYRRVHCSVLLSRHREGGELGPNQLYIGARPKCHPIDIG